MKTKCRRLLIGVLLAFLARSDTPVLAQATVPDWNARLEELKQEAATQFKPPKLGETVKVELTIGGTRTGTLAGFSAGSVVIKSGEKIETFERARLTPASRAELFADDFGHRIASSRLLQERSDYQAQQEAIARSEAAEAAERGRRREEEARREQERREKMALVKKGAIRFDFKAERTLVRTVDGAKCEAKLSYDGDRFLFRCTEEFTRSSPSILDKQAYAEFSDQRRTHFDRTSTHAFFADAQMCKTGLTKFLEWEQNARDNQVRPFQKEFPHFQLIEKMADTFVWTGNEAYLMLSFTHRRHIPLCLELLDEAPQLQKEYEAAFDQELRKQDMFK